MLSLQDIKEIKKYLEGKKTYILSVSGSVMNLLMAFDVINLTTQQSLAIDGLFIAALGGSIRAAINMNSKK